MGRRRNGARTRRRLLLAFAIPALLTGAAVLLITGGGGPSGETSDDLGLASSEISAVPPVGRAPDGGATSDVKRVVTGAPATADPATGDGPRPEEPRPAAPARIAIPAVGVDATVIPVGATADGIKVPPVFEAGWYQAGPRPSEPGRAIVLGHLDSLDGPAAFTQVPEAESGDEVIVTDGDGLTHAFRVMHTVEIAKSDFPADEVYGATRRPSLALITCGGDFDPANGYENNVIVFAREISPD